MGYKRSLLERILRRLIKEMGRLHSFIRYKHKTYVLKRFYEASPVFVLGVQKSGTTAIASLLAKASDSSVTLDIMRAIEQPGSRLLRNYGIEDFDDYVYRYRYEFSKKIIKEPGLTFDYLEIRRLFPKAKFVMIFREPKDNIRSILNRLGVPGDKAVLDFNEWPELKHSPAWRMNLDSSWLGYYPINYIDALAYRWRLAAQIYSDNSESILFVKYEDFLNDKVGMITELVSKLHLKECNNITKDVDKQFQPSGCKVKDYRSFYGENIDYINQQCGKLAEDIGYNSNPEGL